MTKVKNDLLKIIRSGNWKSLRVKDYIKEETGTRTFPMTQEQYVKSNGVTCPFCDSQNITGSELNWKNKYLYQDVTCNACYNEWIDEYKLVGYLQYDDQSGVEIRN